MNKRISKPLTLAEANEAFPAREARERAALSIERRFHVAADSEPALRTRLERIEGGGWEVVVEVDGVDVAQRAHPRAMKGTAVAEDRAAVPEAEVAERLAGFVPDHLAFSVMPQDRVKSRRTIRPKDLDLRVATTIFGNDNRRAFRDTSFPWCTVGVVETGRTSGSGVMIGPRHLLTVSHVIDWAGAPPGYSAGWVKFTPSSFDGSAPFGEAFGSHIYWRVKEDGDGFITGDEGNFDYVVVVLDRRIGDTTGWMGARGYDDAWNTLDVWHHMGYPSDLNSGQRPTWQGNFRMDGTDADAQSILHKADVFPGQSGGPVFGFWPGEPWPRAVAVQSWQDSTTNGASGSKSMRDLVVQARSDFG